MKLILLLIMFISSANASYITYKEADVFLVDGPYTSYAEKEICEKETANDCLCIKDIEPLASDLVSEVDELGIYTGKKHLENSEKKKAQNEAALLQKEADELSIINDKKALKLSCIADIKLATTVAKLRAVYEKCFEVQE